MYSVDWLAFSVVQATAPRRSYPPHISWQDVSSRTSILTAGTGVSVSSAARIAAGGVAVLHKTLLENGKGLNMQAQGIPTPSITRLGAGREKGASPFLAFCVYDLAWITFGAAHGDM